MPSIDIRDINLIVADCITLMKDWDLDVLHTPLPADVIEHILATPIVQCDNVVDSLIWR